MNFLETEVDLVVAMCASERADMLILAFVSSCLDSCNSLLYGLPDYEITKLQQVQNTLPEW